MIFFRRRHGGWPQLAEQEVPRVSLYFGCVAHSGCPGSLPSSCLWTQGVGRAWLQLLCSWPVLCSAGLSRVREQGQDITRARMSPCTHRPRVRTSRPSAAQKAGEQWKEDQKELQSLEKAVCLIFSKRQVVLWMVRKRRRFPWLCNNSLNQPRALQWWHLTGWGFFFNTKYISSEQALESWRGFLVFPSCPGRLVQGTCWPIFLGGQTPFPWA